MGDPGVRVGRVEGGPMSELTGECWMVWINIKGDPSPVLCTAARTRREAIALCDSWLGWRQAYRQEPKAGRLKARRTRLEASR